MSDIDTRGMMLKIYVGSKQQGCRSDFVQTVSLLFA